MGRCIELGDKGIGDVAPNPMVGCVIVENGEIIGEGYHGKYGEAHAEVNAIKAVKKNYADYTRRLKDVTLYVNLEPCSHHGKTPPCSDLIIESGIKKVVIGCLDSNPLVAGKGIEKLRQAGIEVESGVQEAACRKLNKRFFTFHEKHRPYVILKWAQTKDGFIAKKPPFTREENRITNEESNKLSHTWRAEESAILIGTNTALLDNPELTARLSAGKNPLRILIDKDLKVPASNNIFSDNASVMVFTDKDVPDNAHISYFKIDFSGDVISQILTALHLTKIISLIVEGGANLLQQFIDKDLWDEARIFTGDKTFKEGLKAPSFSLSPAQDFKVGDDMLRIYYSTSL